MIVRATWVVVAAVAVGATALLAAHAPLWVYALSLLLFGAPHVLVELRYVDERFSARLSAPVLWSFIAGLGAVALSRALAWAGVGGLVRLELIVGACLVTVASLWLAARQARAASLLAFAIGASLLFGVLVAPLEALVLLALLHNLTPVGFLAERLRGAARRRAMWAAAVTFVLVPITIVCWPFVPGVVGGPVGTGELEAHLGAFVPPGLWGTAVGERLFAAAAYLQVMHYAVVLGVLPRLGGGAERARHVVPWPSPWAFTAAVVVLGGVTTAMFVYDFVGARAGYAVFAAVHAWVEIPVLLIACAAVPVCATAIAVRGPRAA